MRVSDKRSMETQERIAAPKRKAWERSGVDLFVERRRRLRFAGSLFDRDAALFEAEGPGFGEGPLWEGAPKLGGAASLQGTGKSGANRDGASGQKVAEGSGGQAEGPGAIGVTRGLLV